MKTSLLKYLTTGLLLLTTISSHGISLPKDQLIVHWLGTSSYLIQLGDTSLLTDPFYSQHSLISVGFGQIASNPAIVQEVSRELSRFAKPKAIFIGHSHYDHMLDTASLVKTTGWHDVPIVGSQTTKSIIHGYSPAIANQCQLAQVDDQWHQIADGIRYKAILAEHANNIPGLLFYRGQVEQPRIDPPNKAKDFKLGKTYAYVFELTDHGHKAVVYFVGAATRAPIGFPDPSVKTVDLAILCVPSWQYTAGYPQKFVQRLQPRYILPSHYNDFFQTIDSYYQPRRRLFFSGLMAFVEKLKQQAHYPGFQQIFIPAVNQSMRMPL